MNVEDMRHRCTSRVQIWQGIFSKKDTAAAGVRTPGVRAPGIRAAGIRAAGICAARVRAARVRLVLPRLILTASQDVFLKC